MHVHEGAPRTLFATTQQGHTLLLRRYDSAGEAPSHALLEYRNYLTACPEGVPLPPEVPESFPSLDTALQSAWVPFTREPLMDLTVLRVRPTRSGADFLFDFFEDDTIHALYWQRDT